MSATRFHGITSLSLVGIAVVLAAIVLFQTSLALGLIYVGITVAGSIIVVYAFCARCPCKVHCGHVLPGKAAQRFNRQPGPYSGLDMSAMLLAMLVLFAFPQYWLWGHTVLFIAFWTLNVVGVIQIRSFVCRACNNAFCPLNRGYTVPG